MTARNKNTEKTYEAKLERFDSNLWHFHISVPAEIANQFVDGKDRRVMCTLQNNTPFQCALMPDGKGDFFININKTLRDKLKLKLGSDVTYSLQKDDSEFGLPMPEEFAELLKLDDEGNQLFRALTPGKQRTLLYIIDKPKNIDLRIKRAICINDHIKATKGKINYRQLNEMIKNSK